MSERSTSELRPAPHLMELLDHRQPLLYHLGMPKQFLDYQHDDICITVGGCP